MSFYIYNVAVKWANGDLEGFGASALTENQARERAVLKAERKAEDLKITFKALTMTDFAALSVDEQDQIQADWDQSSL